MKDYLRLENNADIKFRSLGVSHYCAPYKEDETFIETIELNEFDVDDAKEKVRDSIALLSYSENYRPYIIEILDTLALYNSDFLTNMHKYITFYWSGIPVLQIKINSGKIEDRQLHISLQKYKSEKANIISEKKTSRIITAGVVGTLILGGIVAGLAIFRSNRY